MAATFPVRIVSPERVLFEGEAEMVVCRPTDGLIAFLHNHVPYLGALADAEVRVVAGDHEVAAAVHGGFVEMRGDHLVVLSDLAELKGDIDVARAEQALHAAQEALARDPDDEEAQAALARAETRLAVAQG